MAIKLVDSAKLDAAMAATADAIREKTDDNAKIAWNATTGFASVIAAIETGKNVEIGSFTPSEDTARITIEHGLGVVPKAAFYVRDSQYPPSDADASYAYMGFAFESANTNENIALFYDSTIGMRFNASRSRLAMSGKPTVFTNIIWAHAFDTATAESIVMYASSGVSFKAGTRYMYVLIGESI